MDDESYMFDDIGDDFEQDKNTWNNQTPKKNLMEEFDRAKNDSEKNEDSFDDIQSFKNQNNSERIDKDEEFN